MTRTLPWGSGKEPPQESAAVSPNPATERRTLPWDKESSASASSRKRPAPRDPGEGSSKRQAVDVDLTQDSRDTQRNSSYVDLTQDDDSVEESIYGCLTTKIVGIQVLLSFSISSPLSLFLGALIPQCCSLHEKGFC